MMSRLKCERLATLAVTKDIIGDPRADPLSPMSTAEGDVRLSRNVDGLVDVVGDALDAQGERLDDDRLHR